MFQWVENVAVKHLSTGFLKFWQWIECRGITAASVIFHKFIPPVSDKSCLTECKSQWTTAEAMYKLYAYDSHVRTQNFVLCLWNMFACYGYGLGGGQGQRTLCMSRFTSLLLCIWGSKLPNLMSHPFLGQSLIIYII